MSRLGKAVVHDGIDQAVEAEECSQDPLMTKFSPSPSIAPITRHRQSPVRTPATSQISGQVEQRQRLPPPQEHPIWPRLRGLMRLIQRIGMCF